MLVGDDGTAVRQLRTTSIEPCSWGWGLEGGRGQVSDIQR